MTIHRVQREKEIKIKISIRDPLVSTGQSPIFLLHLKIPPPSASKQSQVDLPYDSSLQLVQQFLRHGNSLQYNL